MNKKTYLLITVIIAALSFVGCNKQEVDPKRIVEISQCGLRYTAPDTWKPYETTNIIPRSSATTKGDIFAHVQFNYATDASMEKMNTFDLSLDTTELLIPFGEIFVINESKLDSQGVLEAFALYDSKKELKKLNGYHYFMLTDYNGSKGVMSEDEKAVYEELIASLPQVEKSVEVFPFDELEVAQALDKLDRTLTFVSHTLEGEEIGSTIFGDYDLTIVNFWASYCYPDIDETKVLQELKEYLAVNYPRVNLIQIVIDTPEEKAQAIALEAKKAGGGTFQSVMTDEISASWIMNNLEGLPTTVFVDNEAVVHGDQLQGIRTLDEYKLALNEHLTQLGLTGK